MKLLIIYCSMLLPFLLVKTLKSSTAVGAAAPDFQLSDQFDSNFHLRDFNGQVILLIYGDREGGDYFDAWRNPVTQKYKSLMGSRLKVQSIAYLNGIPEFMHFFVKKKFVEGSKKSHNPPISVLLDWHGDIAKLYGFQEHVANVYIVDQLGIVQFIAAGKGSEKELGALLQVMDKVLESTSPEASESWDLKDTFARTSLHPQFREISFLRAPMEK